MKRVILIIAFLLLPIGVFAQTATVTGHVILPNGGGVPSKASVNFTLQNYKPDLPRLTTGTIVTNTAFAVSVAIDGSFSTPLARNDFITPIGTYWRVDYMYNGVQSASANFLITHSPFNLDTEIPINPTIIIGPNQIITQSYLHQQPTASTTWTVTHNLAETNPIVEVFDLSGKLLWPDTITNTTANTTVITFVNPIAGRALLIHAGSVNIATNQPNAIVSNPIGPQSISGALGISAGTIFSGSNSHTGLETFANINNVRAVDGTKYAQTGAGIQAVLNDTAAALGGTIFIPCGSYPVSSPITYSGGGSFSWGMLIQGADWTCTKLVAVGALPYFFDNGTPGTTAAAITFKDLQLVGGGTATGGIHLNNVNYGSIERVWTANINGYDVVDEPVFQNIHRIVGNRFEHNFETNSRCINVLADWVHMDDNVCAKVLNEAVTVGSLSVKPYSVTSNNFHCYQCRDYIFSLTQVLEFAAYSTSEELQPGVAKTNEFGVNIKSTITDPATVSIYDWHVQTIGGAHAAYLPILNNGSPGALGVAVIGGQNAVSTTLPGPFIIPYSNDQAVGRATFDSLTNKTLVASTLSGLTAGASLQLAFDEGSAPAGLAANDLCYGDSSAHALKCRYNNGSPGQVLLDNNILINSAPTGSNLQGTDTKLLSAGTVSGTAAPLCTSALGGATTVGCPTAVIIRTGSASGCTTAGSTFDTCDTTVNWNSSFADTTYTPTCMGTGPTNPRAMIQGWISKSTTSIVVRTVSEGAAAVGFATITCTGAHL